MMNDVVIRKGRQEDAEDFSRLIMFTGQELYEGLFGNNAPAVLGKLFKNKGNYYSFEHSYFMEVDGRIAGMTVLFGYEDKEKEFFRLVMLLLKYLNLGIIPLAIPLLRSSRICGQLKKGDLHSANSAVYPEFRGRGLGERLFGVAEEKVRKEGFRRIVVNVKDDNEAALGLRKKLGYRIERQRPPLKIGNKVFTYLELIKDVQR